MESITIFDQDGMVVDVEEAPVDGIPLVDGMDGRT